MNIKKILVPVLFAMLISLGSTAISAQGEWVKLGEKDVNFKLDHDTIGAESKGPIREIHLRVLTAPIKFTKVIINYKDGEKKELEYLEDVQVGKDSRSITIEGDGHVIKTIEFWYETDTLGDKKAKVEVYGRS